ncbi:Universal stress protein family protein [Malonomonas rubra DSM 5091]|uniref:Universal stress protein family protein n=1 Tax=Malonomonas rubra DSM 5091 TaxID=1122189 RepID=A0A1M6I5N4_MALRU|nr:universal stress protein [Malonomonas rubra]SHJ29735.1 Universal stress protein family protein [Malonomonas rubra DSM 5091]
MNLKDILVHIDNRQTCKSRLQVAIQLAKQQSAFLSGIYVIPHPYYASKHIDQQAQAEIARKQFEQTVTEAGLDSEWICVDSVKTGLDLPHALNLHAHYRDLLIISQTDMDKPDRATPHNLPEKTVLGSGRPVLIVPYAGQFKNVGQQVMLAWRGGPESSRALHDAMPLLRSASHVQVMTIQGQHGDEAYEAHDADICQHLSRYGLPGLEGEKHITAGLSVGDMLLNRCADEGIDLLVLGAFSQYRRGHQTLGEVGRYLLDYMTVPVLMSH